MEDLKLNVAKILTTQYGLDSDDVDDLIDSSVKDEPDIWNENSDPAQLANHLASDEDND